MMRLWQTTLNHQERKYAHWRKIPKRSRNPRPLGNLAHTAFVAALCSRCLGVPNRLQSESSHWGHGRRGTSHFVQATATGPLIT
jgi:hypothetical protein